MVWPMPVSSLELTHWLAQSLYLVALISAPFVAACLVMGLIGGAVQGAIRLQDATLGFALKLGGVAVVLFFAGTWTLGLLTQFTQRAWENLGQWMR